MNSESRWLTIAARLIAPAKALGLLAALSPVLVVSAISGGAVGLIGAGILVVIGIPVAGFTWSQWKATARGLQLAESIRDVQVLKHADAEAFSQPIAALRGRAADERVALPSVVGAEMGPVAKVLPVTRQESGSFWNALTAAERYELEAVARHFTYAAGEVLWHGGEFAEYVILIRSGRTKICTADEQVIAFRGPGDLIGERAALRRSSRSATVVAVEVVRALLITTGRFNAFVGEHPHLLDIIEGQVYERLVERPVESSWSGQNCSILFADIAGFGALTRSERDRWLIRQRMYVIIRHAWAAAGMTWEDSHQEDRGDGVLAIVAPDTPTRLIAGPLFAALTTELREHNGQAADTVRIQLRVSLHVGPVTSDANGVTGDAIILAARLLEAPILKHELEATGADVGFIISDFVHDTTLSRIGEYQQVAVEVKEARIGAWMRLAVPGPQEQSA